MPSSAERRARGGKAPSELIRFQGAFARAVSRPLRVDGRASSRGTRGEAGMRLRGANGFSGAERLAVYNRQYWFRLVACMQEEFPCALHVLGLESFNAWAVRFLKALPPASPYLSDLDARFPAYLARHYRPERGSDRGSARGARHREKALQAAAYDKAVARAFEGAEGAPPREGRLVLAPHVALLELDWDFAAYRARCREDAELTAKPPLKARRRAICLYRRDGVVYEKRMAREEYRLLRGLEKPRTLPVLFRALEREAPGSLAKVGKRVAGWFREWTALGLIAAG